VHFPDSTDGQPTGDGPHLGPRRNPADRPRQAGDRSRPSGGRLATDRRRLPPTDGSLLRDSHSDAGADGVVTGHGAATGHGRRALAVMATLVAAVALLAAGMAIGSYLANGRSGGRADAAGRTTHRDNRQPPAFFPPPVNVRAEAARTGRPAVAINQPCGDPHTTFVVLGAGFTPGRPVTIRLAGVGISPDHPFADGAGVFSYVINQAREFFPGPVPPGKYRVVVTALGGTRRTARFIVKPGRIPPMPC